LRNNSSNQSGDYIYHPLHHTKILHSAYTVYLHNSIYCLDESQAHEKDPNGNLKNMVQIQRRKHGLKSTDGVSRNNLGDGIKNYEMGCCENTVLMYL
jgi:hypothetical protein